MDQAYTLHVFAENETDITGIIRTICDNTRTIREYQAKPDLEKIKSLVIRRGDEVKTYKLSNPPFFIYGGLGIVFGLNDYDTGISGIQYVLKVDCPQGRAQHFGLVMKTAISINDRFGQYPEEQYNMAHSYGTLSGEPRTFAIYKYNGVELGTIIYNPSFINIRNEGLVKDILHNVILALHRFNSKFLLHNDFCTENLVINPDTLEVALVDLDTMTDLADLSKSTKCAFILGMDDIGRKNIEVCPEPKPANGVGCVKYPLQWGRSLVPGISRLLGFSELEIKNLNDRNSVYRNSSKTVPSLMMADRFGLFWVIIKILLTAGGLDEEHIEKLFDIDYRKPTTYTKFYSSITKSTIPRIVSVIKANATYIKSGFFEDFIMVVINLITDFSIDNIAAFDALLNHQFFQVPEEELLQDQSPPVQDQSSPVQGQSPPIQDQSSPLQASAGGSHKKKRRPARINRRTKKRYTRNKQNRQNRTKRGQTKQSRK